MRIERVRMRRGEERRERKEGSKKSIGRSRGLQQPKQEGTEYHVTKTNEPLPF
jgi:hypothetical protein